VTDVNEVSGVDWYNVDSITTLYASHKEWLEMVKAKFHPPASNGPAYPFARR
jgi:hypothetical protein